MLKIATSFSGGLNDVQKCRMSFIEEVFYCIGFIDGMKFYQRKSNKQISKESIKEYILYGRI